MRKITKNQFHQKTSRRRNPLTKAIDEIKVGEALEVKKSEHKGKATFAGTVSATFNKKATSKKFKVRALADRSGWAVLRIK